MFASKAAESWPERSEAPPSSSSEAGVAEGFDSEALPHMNDIFRAAARITGDRQRAEDVVQEVYLQAWKSFHRFEPGTNCRAWLFKILFHCVNHHRRKWFRFPLLKDTEEFLEANLAAPAQIPEHLTDEEILAALDRLPADFRSVVLLVDVEEFAYKEAADILAIPIGTVMSRLSRGRKLLREQLTDVARSYGIAVAAGEGRSA
jgi:RNA polymerase sigma-70 factor (ECF subfamily)